MMHIGNRKCRLKTLVTEVKITYSRHTSYNSQYTIHQLVYGNTVPFRKTALWWVSILFTTPDKFTILLKTHHHWNSPYFRKIKKFAPLVRLCTDDGSTNPSCTHNTISSLNLLLSPSLTYNEVTNQRNQYHSYPAHTPHHPHKRTNQSY